MKKFIVFFILIAGILVFTNPDSEDFTSYVKQRMERKISDSGDDAVTDFVAKNLPELAEGVVAKMVERRNFLVYSVYELDMGRNSYRYIGIGTFFIPLQKDQPFNL
jgi:hypothetical protein